MTWSTGAALAGAWRTGRLGLGAASCGPEQESRAHAASVTTAAAPNSLADLTVTSHARHYPSAGGRTRLPRLCGGRPRRAAALVRPGVRPVAGDRLVEQRQRPDRGD